MIKLNIIINPDDIPPDKPKYDNDVTVSLGSIAAKVPNHTDGDFLNRLWGDFKQVLWEQQGYKCAFCEKSITLGSSHVEHFRAKSKTCDENNNEITRKAYWWLAYDHRNYTVSCSTCNYQKGNKFPIEDETTRVTASNMDDIISLDDNGVLVDEVPYIINPRYKNPEPHLTYSYTPCLRNPMVHIGFSDNTGKISIAVLDLNRTRLNQQLTKDFLPQKRGSVLSDFKKEIQKFGSLKKDLVNHRRSLISAPDSAQLEAVVDSIELTMNKKQANIKERFLSKTAEFSGMCFYWLNNDTDLKDSFTEEAS